MKFTQLSGTCIVPTLSRLVLALAFIPAGYNKMMTTSEFDGAQAATLLGLGVKVERIVEQARADGTGRSVILAGFRQDEGQGAKQVDEPEEGEEKPQSQAQDPAEDPAEDTAEDPAEEPARDEDPLEPGDEQNGEAGGADAAGEESSEPPAPEETVEPDAEADEPAPLSDDAPAGPSSAARYTAAAMHNVTLLCPGAGWPAPHRLALLAAITEFVGGLLLLVGFLSRVWGFGLAISMGVAFYLLSMRLNGVISMGPFKAAADIAKFNAMFAQLDLLVLAFGVFLTGPGPLSLDRILFRRDTDGDGKSDLDLPGGERGQTVPLVGRRPM